MSNSKLKWCAVLLLKLNFHKHISSNQRVSLFKKKKKKTQGCV